MAHRLRAAQLGGMTEGVIWQQLLLFFMPTWFGTLFQQLYNTADTVIVGRFVGTGALAPWCCWWWAFPPGFPAGRR